MSIAEHHSLSRQSIEIRRFDFTVLRVERLHVAVAEIVSQDVNNVWTRRLGDRRRFRLNRDHEHPHDCNFKECVHVDDGSVELEKAQRCSE